MQKFKSNDRIVLKKHMDRPLDKFVVEYLDSLGCMIWHDDEVVCQIDEEEQRRARV